MARLFTCGFEENNLAATMWTLAEGTAPTIVTAVTVAPHSGTYSLRVNPAAAISSERRDLASAMTTGTLYTRFYFRVAALPAATTRIWMVRNSTGGTVWFLQLLTTGAIRINNSAAGNTLFTSSATLSANTWYRLELRHLLSDTAGQIEVRLYLGDSTTPIETWGDGNFTGGDGTDADTLVTDVQRWHFGSSGENATIDAFYDDIAVNDATGSIQTSWPGPGKIAIVEPGSDLTTQWEDETSGSSTFTNINELPGTPDDANYNMEQVTLNSFDRFQVTALPAEVPANADMILLDLYARVGSNQTAATTGRLKIWDQLIAVTDGPNVSFAVSGWRIVSTTEHLAVDLGTRTKAQVDGYSLGYENLTDAATRPRRVSALWANVEWIESSQSQAPRSMAMHRMRRH